MKLFGDNIQRQNMAAFIKNRNQLMPCAFADFIIVEIMSRRNLDCARAFFRVRIFISDNRHAAAHNRQDNFFTNKTSITFIIRMDSDARITQHSFRARRCHNNIAARLMARHITFFIRKWMFISHAVRERITQMPIVTINRFCLNFEI